MAKLQSGTRIYGTANVDTILYVNTYAVVNATGIYTTGTSNAASYTVGSSFVANTTGAYHTGTINALSYSVGTAFTANATLVNAVAISTSTNTVTIGTAAYHVSNGNFGIANSAPADKLAVAGTSYFNGNATFNGVAAFYNVNGQANASAGAFVGNAYATLGGSSGNYLAFGQQTSFAQWIQSGYSSAGSPAYYSIILNPLGGNIGIGNTAPSDRLSVNGTSYFSGNVILGNSSIAVGLQANGGYGTSGQVLTSNGTATYWAAAAAGVNTAAQYAWTNTHSFSNTVTLTAVSSNGSLGTAGQILASNGTSTYWVSPGAASVDQAAQFNWTNTHTFNANLYIAATSKLIINPAAGIYANGGLGSAGQVLTSTGTGNVYWSTVSGGGNTVTTKTFSIIGPFIGPVAGTARYYPINSIVIGKIQTSLNEPAATDIVINVNKNGSLLQSVNLYSSNTKSLTSGLNHSITPDDYITVDIYSGYGNNINVTLST